MFGNKKHVDRRIDAKASLQFLGEISRSLYLAQQLSNPGKKLVVKVVPLHTDNQQFWRQVENKLRVICSAPVYYLKPEAYDIRDASVYLCTPVQHLSLQSLLWIHQKESRSLSREFVRQFIVRVFDGLARLKPSDVVPENMKPSNLFLEERPQEERNWLWAEAGLPSENHNQHYLKVSLAANKSIQLDPLEMEFYAIGVMLLEMLTLEPAQEIDRVLRSRGTWGQIKHFREAEDYYGQRVVNIIHMFVNPPKDGSLRQAVQEYKQLVEEEDEAPNYEAYYFTAERLEGYLKDNLLKKI
jgi:serine/threonine protein kinase